MLASENNGTRIYDFDRDGSIRSKPIAANENLSPDSSTPVLVGGRLFELEIFADATSPGMLEQL